MIYVVKDWLVSGAGILDSMAAASLKTFVLFAFIFLLLKLFRVKDPRIQHLAWFFVLCGMLILPVTSFLVKPPVSFALLPENSRPGILELTKFTANNESKTTGRPEFINDSNISSKEVSANEPKALPEEINTGSKNIEQSTARPFFSGYPEMLQVSLSAIYFLGLFIMLFRFAGGLLRTGRLLKNCKEVDDKRITELCAQLAKDSFFKCRITVLTCGGTLLPVTTGLFHTRILLPEDWINWEELKIKSVIAHEMAHIRRKDYLFLLLAAFNKCVNWFNPLSWFIARRLSDIAETASDNSAIGFVKDSRQYATYLLELAANTKNNRLKISNVPMARNAQVVTRINSILRSDSISTNEGRYLKAMIGVLGCGWLLAVIIIGLELWSAKSGELSPAAKLETVVNNTIETPLMPAVNLSTNSLKPTPGQTFELKPEYKAEPKQSLGETADNKSQPVLPVQPNSTALQNNVGETTPAGNQSLNNTKTLGDNTSSAPVKSVKEESTREPAENKTNNAVEALISALNDSNPRVREKAAEALREIGDKRAAEILKDKTVPKSIPKSEPKPAPTLTPRLKEN